MGESSDPGVNSLAGCQDPPVELHSVLTAHLDAHREHVLTAIKGLGDKLDRVVAPSGWTLRGMVTHLLYDVEILWMGAVLGADPAAMAPAAAPVSRGRRPRQRAAAHG